LIDDQAKAPIFKEERQPIPPIILIDTAFAQARDLPLAHPGVNEGRLNPQALPDDACIDAGGQPL
jgi:hypothetical protein